MDKDYHDLGIDAADARLLDSASKVPPHGFPEGTPVREVPQPKDIPVRGIGEPFRADSLVSDIAMICHEANRAYCITLGDFTQRPWSQAPAWQLSSAENGVRAHMAALAAGGQLTPRESHESWLRQKELEGWTYGVTKDVVNRQHPCMVPYDQLPEAQRRKDHLFGAIVKALVGPL